MNWYKTSNTIPNVNGKYILNDLEISKNDNIIFILRELEKKGYTGLFVGGCVRDAIMSKTYKSAVQSKDIDVEVYGIDLEDLVNMLDFLCKTIENQNPDILSAGVVKNKDEESGITGKSFGVIKVNIKYKNEQQEDYDFSLPRRDSKTSEGGYKGFVSEFDKNMTPMDAASRRDFTINAMAYNPLTNEMYDYFGGVKDIEERKLRATSEKFKEDPLRVLRGMQSSSRFGFELDHETAEMCKECYHESSKLTQERIGIEWAKFFTKGKNPGKCLNFLIESGWIEAYPELKKMIGIEQDSQHHPEHLLENHVSQSLDNAAKIADRESLSDRDRMVLLLSALCHDMGKQTSTKINDKGGITSHGHHLEGIELAKSFIEKIGIEKTGEGKKITGEIEKLVRYHMIDALGEYEKDNSKKNIYKLADNLYPSNINMLTLLMEVDKTSRQPLDENGNPINEDINNEKLQHIIELRKDAENNGVLYGKEFNYFLGPKYNEEQKAINPDYKNQLHNIIQNKKNGYLIGILNQILEENRKIGGNNLLKTESDAIEFAKKALIEMMLFGTKDENNIYLFKTIKWGKNLPPTPLLNRNDIIDKINDAKRYMNYNLSSKEGGEMTEDIKNVLRDKCMEKMNEGNMGDLNREYILGIINNEVDARIGYDINPPIQSDNEVTPIINDEIPEQPPISSPDTEENKLSKTKNTMLKFSDHNLNYVPTQSMEETLLNEMKSNNPEWETIYSLFRESEKEHVDDIKEFYSEYPEECTETYKEIFEESLMRNVHAYIDSKKQPIYNDIFEIDFKDPFSDIKNIFGNEIVDYALNLIFKINPDALGGIVYVGILRKGEELGMFYEEFDNKVKNIYYSELNPNIKEIDIVSKQKERHGISILINPENIEKEAYRLLPADYDEEDETEMISLVLAEIIMHETEHAIGIGNEEPANGEERPVQIQRDFLTKALNIVNNQRKKTGKEPFDVDLKGK